MLFLRNPCTIFKFWEQAVEVLIDDWIGLADTTMPLHFLSAVQLRQLLPNCCRNRRSFQYGCCFPTVPVPFRWPLVLRYDSLEEFIQPLPMFFESRFFVRTTSRKKAGP